MLGRALDDSFTDEVRHRITLLTAARTAANACFRFAPPFLASIAASQHVTLDRIGVALACSELSGLTATLIGRAAERIRRRHAMAIGLVGIAVAVTIAAIAVHIVVFGAGLVLLTQSKMLFDMGLTAWVADRVPYERRGRAMALTETSWALGLLLGVSTMGLVAAATNWRVGYAVGGLVVVTMAASIVKSLPESSPARRTTSAGHTVATPFAPHAWNLAIAMFCLMGASQTLFVTWGTWLKDRFGMSNGGVSTVAFLLGFAELAASLLAARSADRHGKARSAMTGALLMVPAALVLATWNHRLVVALPLLALAIAAFEYSVVCALPMATEIAPGAPAKGLSLTLSAGLLGRASASIPSTRLYVSHGFGVPALLCAVLATLTALGMWRLMRVDQPGAAA